MRALELFSGGGGAALGIRAAGCVGYGVEWDAQAVATSRAAGLTVEQADIREWSGNDWRAKHGSPWLLWASPPCQAFSQAGQRKGAADERNGWPWTLRIVDEVQPRWVVCENVVGLTQHSAESCGDVLTCPGCYWIREVVPAFAERFPSVSVWKLNAANYGVPQTRWRVFLIAGPTAPRPPRQTHAEPAACVGLFGDLLPWVTMGEALKLGDSERAIGGGSNPTGAGRGDERTHRDLTDEPCVTVATLSGGGAGNYGPWIVDSGRNSEANPTQERARGSAERASTVSGGGNLMLRPSPAICTTDGVGLGSCYARDAVERATGRRRLTVAECAALQGFPADHPWQGTKATQYRQVGNAVPPIVAQRITEALQAADR